MAISCGGLVHRGQRTLNLEVVGSNTTVYRIDVEMFLGDAS